MEMERKERVRMENRRGSEGSETREKERWQEEKEEGRKLKANG